jgi:hypothetical protein
LLKMAASGSAYHPLKTGFPERGFAAGKASLLWLGSVCAAWVKTARVFRKKASKTVLRVWVSFIVALD